MKAVVCTGTPWGGLEQMGTVLNAAGVQPPMDPVRGNATIDSFHALLMNAGQPENQSVVDQPVHPGKIWGQQALGILQDNLNQQVWGWTNPFSTWLLEFWKSLDLNIYFILVYSSPEEDISRFMQNVVNPSSEVAADLWRSYNTQLLRFYNRNRKRCLLVSRNAGLSDPSSLLKLCSERFDVSLQLDAVALDTQTEKLDPIGFVLSQRLLQGRQDVHTLYNEIQATATLPDGEDYQKQVDEAWPAYRQLSLTITEQQERYATESADQARQLEQQHQELEQCREENKLLLLQLHQVQEELEAIFLESQKKQTDCAARLEEQKQQLEKSRGAIEEYRKRVEQLQRENRALAEAQENSAVGLEEQAEAKSRELEQENELLLLQLHQVQEELEHYFLLYQKSQRHQEEQAASVQQDGRMKLQMSELALRENWYEVAELDEEELRWSGPGARATIMLPIKRDMDQLLVVHYKQVVAQDQLKGIHIEVDGEQVSHAIYDTLSQKYIVVKLTAMEKESTSDTELAIVLPHTVKPSDVVSESPDDRPLGIAVYSLSILPVMPSLRINWPDTSYRRLRLKRRINRIGEGVASFPLAYFDGKAYLQEYPDVAEAVNQGTVPSAFVHYVEHGFYDGHDFMLADTQLPSEGDANDLARIEQQ
ncbi:MAG TPA: hypothetical protein ENI88_05825 [Desulfobulbus sp.]|nr:hypothetical protein [Desulfobulbus sp.]